MHQDAVKAEAAEHLTQAFEHSITWEDDIWRADPVDVASVHAKARRKFQDLLNAVRSSNGSSTQARILLFHGQSGAGKTHLLRALRTATHRDGSAYFGYAQMTPDVTNYADYYLRRLVHSLEKPYSPDDGGETALTRLTNRLVTDAEVLAKKDLDQLRDAALDEDDLARLVLRIADGIVAAPKFADQELDINIVRALLYLERRDPRIDQRIRQYLHGRMLTPLAHQAVGALDPNVGEDRAFEIFTSLGKLIWTVERAALVFTIDQVEDLRFFDNPEERFQKAVRDLIQIANRLSNAIVIISCLEDFYGQVRCVLAQSYIDRIEKAGPVALLESRTPDEARRIIAKRLEHEAETSGGGLSFPDPAQFFGPQFFEEFGGLSTRRLLEHAQSRLREKTNPEPEERENEHGWTSTLASVLGGIFGGGDTSDPSSGGGVLAIDYRETWERFQNASEAEIPSDDAELLDVLTAALLLAKEEWDGGVRIAIERLEIADDLPAFDLALRHSKSGLTSEARVFLCNRKTQGGGLKRQLDKALNSMAGKACFMLRASDFPPNGKNQTAQAMRKFREGGGRPLLVPIPEWERMMTVREFHAHHRHDPGFGAWFESSKLLSNLIPVIQLLRLDLLGRSLPKVANDAVAARAMPLALPAETEAPSAAGPLPRSETGEPNSIPPGPSTPWASAWGDDSPEPLPANDDELPLSVILDENGSSGTSILAGRQIGARAKPITLNMNVLKRHGAVLGGSGSGKTTLALCIIEQLLLKGIPAVLIDRKGDLCSYANPDVWRANESEFTERRGEREKLADAIDVAVYTPGRSSGRPISITLLPNGINELPDHEQQLLANLSAAALGDMLHLKNSATHQKQSGTLSVALRILGSRHSREVTLADLIMLLEDEDPELTDLTQRMDPSGKIRRDLVAQLELPAPPQCRSFRGRRRAVANGQPSRARSIRSRWAYAPFNHLHGLPRRQREHPVLGIAVPVRSAAFLPAQPERRIAGRRYVRRSRPLHSRQLQAGDR